MEKKKVRTITGVCVCKGNTWSWKVDYVRDMLTLTCEQCGREAHFQLQNPSRDMKLDSIAEAAKAEQKAKALRQRPLEVGGGQ